MDDEKISIEDCWAYWLNSQNFEIKDELIEEEFRKFQTELKSLYETQKMIKNDNYLNKKSNYILVEGIDPAGLIYKIKKIYQDRKKENKNKNVEKLWEQVIKLSELSIQSNSNQFLAYIHKAVAQYQLKVKITEIKENYEKARHNLRNEICVLISFIETSKELNCNLNQRKLIEIKMNFYNSIDNEILDVNIENLEKGNKMRAVDMTSIFYDKKMKYELQEMGLQYNFNLISRKDLYVYPAILMFSGVVQIGLELLFPVVPFLYGKVDLISSNQSLACYLVKPLTGKVILYKKQLVIL